ncbi:MAG: zinc ribbon domain-containing protein [Candidatus Thermoplasmatota archaeon]|nr:zinc ribbon domain-containing protein [Candidatus Thermoplasmatota archaeon]
MDVLPLKGPSRMKEAGVRRTPPVVSWIAIVTGVFLVGIGLLLLLWGLSWQGAQEETDPLEPDTSVGGPFLLPAGVFTVALGFIWVLTGYRGFPRGGPAKRPCPRCGKPLEPDLSFCYHCGEEIPPDPKGDGSDPVVRRR